MPRKKRKKWAFGAPYCPTEAEIATEAAKIRAAKIRHRMEHGAPAAPGRTIKVISDPNPRSAYWDRLD